MEDWYFIINPVSGYGKGAKAWSQAQPYLQNIPHAYAITSYAHHATDLAKQAIEKGYRSIICIGGDGTLHDVVNGIMQQQTVASQDIKVGLISVGTGNDWVKTYGMPSDIKAAIDLFQAGKTHWQDLGQLNIENEKPVFFHNIAGVGFDAAVVEKTQKSSSGALGQMIYLKGMLSALFGYQCLPVKVEVNGKSIESKTYLTLCCINRFAGGGMQFNPSGINNDGLFEVIVVKEMNKLQVLMRIPKLYSGKYLDLKEVEVHRSNTVKIYPGNGAELMRTEADGELYGHGPYVFTCLPKALQVFVPATYQG
jgi:YegS/Rv2252/BmrU family lipid kinase